MRYILFFLIPFSLSASHHDRENAEVYVEGNYFVIETEHHKFYIEEMRHDPDCKCEWSFGEVLIIED